MAKMAKDLQVLAIQIGHLHDGDILLLRPEPFRFFFHVQIWYSQRGLNNKSLNLHKKANPWRIPVVVVKWRHHANGLLDAKSVPLETGIWRFWRKWQIFARGLAIQFGGQKWTLFEWQFLRNLRLRRKRQNLAKMANLAQMAISRMWQIFKLDAK